jgi:membrane-associated phospholipid phosphatase
MTANEGRPINDICIRRLWLARTVVVAIGLGLWFFTQSLIGSRTLDTTSNAAGIPLSRGDGLFRLTQPVNEALHARPQLANALLIASSAVIDALGIWLIVASICGASIRPFLGLLLVFALRQLTQALCVLPTPDGMIWRNPGWPSFLVTYQVANDFFFSGHTAIAVFGATQLARLKRTAYIVLGIAIALFEIAALIVLRAHYTIDVFTGAIVALWAAYIADRAAPVVDRALRRLASKSEC